MISNTVILNLDIGRVSFRISPTLFSLMFFSFFFLILISKVIVLIELNHKVQEYVKLKCSLCNSVGEDQYMSKVLSIARNEVFIV